MTPPVYIAVYGLNIALAVILGSFVYFKNPSNSLNRFSLALCLMYSYLTITYFGNALAPTPDIALMWAKAAAFTPLIVAFLLNYAIFSAKLDMILRSKVFYIIIYGYAIFFTAINLFTTLILGSYVLQNDIWTSINPEVPSLFYLNEALRIIVQGFAVVTGLSWFFREKDEVRRFQAEYTTIGIIVLAVGTPYIPALGLLLICYGVTRYGVNALTPDLSAEILIDYLPEFLILVNQQGKVQFGNRVACESLGYTRQELLSLSFKRITFQHTNVETPKDMSAEFQRAGHSHDLEMIFKGKEGKQVPLAVTIAEMRTNRGKFQGLLYLGWDAASIQQREKESAKSQQNIQEANDAKIDFLATETSEIQVANNYIHANALAILSNSHTPLKAAQKLHLYAIVEKAESISTIIKEMRELLENEQDDFALNRQELPLKPLLETILDIFKEDAQKQGIMLVVEIPDDVGSVQGDKRMITQVVYVLLRNAVKFTPGGGQVGIRARRSNEAVQITVWDTSPGMTKREIEHLFRSSKKTKNPENNAREGRDLGLYFCKKFVALHGGRIWVESEIGQGSQYHFTISTNLPES